MRVAIIDYGSGNLRSATKAFERAAHEAGIDAHIDLTDRAEDVAAADRIVLPGVGAYADCRRGLDAVPDMAEVLIEAVEKKARPFLGICVGMHYAVLPGSATGEDRVPPEGEMVGLAAGFSLPALRLLTGVCSPLAILMAKVPDIGR